MHVLRLVAAMLVAAGFASSSAIAAPCGGFTDELAIGQQDADGVALAAIQGLHTRGRERDAQLHEQAARIESLEAELSQLRLAVDSLPTRLR